MGSLLKSQNAVDNLVGNEGTIKFAIAIEFLMFCSVMVLSWALYMILKPINNSIALFGLIFRISEAILGLVVIIFYLGILLLLSGADYLQVFQPEQLQGLARFLGKLGGVGYYILLFTMVVGAVVYCYLFYISRYIPKALAVWGIITYSTMIIYGLINIATHNPPSE